MAPPEWRLDVSRSAQRDIDDLPSEMKRRVRDAIDGLCAAPALGDIAKLQGGGDRYRLRVGEWRVIFRRVKADRTVIVTDVVLRGRAYRD